LPVEEGKREGSVLIPTLDVTGYYAEEIKKIKQNYNRGQKKEKEKKISYLDLQCLLYKLQLTDSKYTRHSIEIRENT
jgi:hypothetical protein